MKIKIETYEDYKLYINNTIPETEKGKLMKELALEAFKQGVMQYYREVVEKEGVTKGVVQVYDF